MSVDPQEGAETSAGTDVGGNVDMAKEAAGRRAAELVEAGMRVGLGTGTTVHWTIVALGERRLADLVCVATSSGTERLARSVGLRLVPPDDAGRLDLAVDGADEVDAHWNLVKGGGGALAREKVVAEMADRFLVVVDGSKVVTRLGAFGLPVEALAFAPGVVAARLRSLGAARGSSAGPSPPTTGTRCSGRTSARSLTRPSWRPGSAACPGSWNTACSWARPSPR